MDAQSLIRAVIWLAILGLVVIFGARIVGNVAGKASAAI